MQDRSPPKSTKPLRGFLGLICFYCHFIQDYAKIAAPLTTLLCIDGFQWSFEALSVFQSLMISMTLALLDFSIPFSLETNASDTRIKFL